MTLALRGVQSASSPGTPTRNWTRILSDYREPDRRRSAFELAVTIVPFAAFLSLAHVATHNDFYWGLLLVVPAAGFLLRLFMIQHDCGHGSFFANRKADDWTGRVLGVLTLTPYDYWRRAHTVHHASAGNLDARGVGDITTLTVAEYRELPLRGRLAYRLYRSPVVMFLVGPVWVFGIQQRWPVGMTRAGLEPWLSTMMTNVAILALAISQIWLLGLGSFMLVQVPIIMLAGMAGVWLFYVQHQFEETHWEQSEDWEFQDAALHGSSYYDLPGPLKWLTGNIGIHHVHHLASRVPFYRLPEVLKDHPELRSINRITFLQSLRCIPLVLWDERSRKLVSFKRAAALGHRE
jgi:omega-6 fatty acid desaturase (delta-12 desaturase)